MAKAQMITKKGYPEAMQSFMISKISELQGQNDALHGLYMQEQGKAEAKHESMTDSIEHNTRLVDEAVKAMEEELKKFNKKHGVSIANMTDEA